MESRKIKMNDVAGTGILFYVEAPLELPVKLPGDHWHLASWVEGRTNLKSSDYITCIHFLGVF